MAKKTDYPRLTDVSEGVSNTWSAYTLSKVHALELASFINDQRDKDTFTIWCEGIPSLRFTNIESGRLLVELV